MTITIHPKDEAIAKLWMKGRYPQAEAMIDGLQMLPGTVIYLRDQIDANTYALVTITVVADPATPST